MVDWNMLRNICSEIVGLITQTISLHKTFSNLHSENLEDFLTVKEKLGIQIKYD